MISVTGLLKNTILIFSSYILNHDHFLAAVIGKGYDKVSLRKNYPGPQRDSSGHREAQCNTIVNIIDMS